MSNKFKKKENLIDKVSVKCYIVSILTKCQLKLYNYKGGL